MGRIVGLEQSFIQWIQGGMNGFLTSFFSVITEFGDVMLSVAVIGLFYWAVNKKLGQKLLIYASLVSLVNPFLKVLVKRLRPYMENSDIKCLKKVASEGDVNDVVTQGYSFPSGHASNSLAAYGTLAASTRRTLLKVLLGVLIVLVGVSRFALGVHYPTDVLAGWAVACLCIALYNLLEKKIGRNRVFLLLDAAGLICFAFIRMNEYYTGYGMLLGGTLGILFEEKYVCFEETKNPLIAALRTVLGVLIYLGLNTLLKLPFSTAFLDGGSFWSFVVRAARYAVVCFVLLGIYPMCFRYIDKQK